MTERKTTAIGHNDAPYALALFLLGNAPEGDVDAAFVQGVWGNNLNLWCCFALEDGSRFRLSTFSGEDYAPREGGPSFRHANSGELYRLTIGRSKTGYPTFLKAEQIS